MCVDGTDTTPFVYEHLVLYMRVAGWGPVVGVGGGGEGKGFPSRPGGEGIVMGGVVMKVKGAVECSCSGGAGGGWRWSGRGMPLHVPLFLRNDGTVGLRDHVVGYLGFGVVLEGQSPLVVVPALAFVHREIGPLQVLLLGVEVALAGLEAAGSADLGRLLLVVRVVRVLQVLGDGRVGGQPPGFAVAVAEHVLLGAVVTFEGVLAAAQEYEEQDGRQDQKGHPPNSAPDCGLSTVRLPRDLGVLGWRVVREFWVGKDRWKGVCQCSGGRRCNCAGADFFFFFFLSSGKMKGDKDGKAKGKGQDPPHPAGAPTPSLTITCRYETAAGAAEKHSGVKQAGEIRVRRRQHAPEKKKAHRCPCWWEVGGGVGVVVWQKHDFTWIFRGNRRRLTGSIQISVTTRRRKAQFWNIRG